MENESPRRAVTDHTFEPKEPQRRKEKETQILENMQRVSQDTGQQNVGVCAMATWEWAHSHGIQILSKANELKADLPTSKLSFQIPSWAETSCKAPKAPGKFAWRSFVLTKLKLPSVSFFLQRNVSAPFLPLAGGYRRSVNAEDANVTQLSLP